MNYSNASSNNPSKKIKLTIIPSRQLFINISSDEDVTTTPSPTTNSSSRTPPNAPSQTTSTNQTSSSHVPPRPLNPQPLQNHPSLDITLSLSPITHLDHIHDTPSPPSSPQPQPPIIENPDDEVDERSSEEYLRDLDIEYHERDLLANLKYKKRNNFPGQKDKEEVFDEEEVTQVKVLMALDDDELTVGKNHSRNGEWLDITMIKRHIREPIWYLDSGCSRSMTGIKSHLHKYVEQPGHKVVFGDNSSCITEGYGSINCRGIVFTIAAFVNGLKKNSQAPEMIMSFIRMVENQNDVKVKQIRTDNRTEFRNHELESFCDEKGISQNFSSPYTPEQNGVAKRKNRILIEAARTMQNGSVISNHFRTDAVRIAFYTQNRSIILKRHDKTSYEVFRERIPDISYFYVFGCLVFIHNHRDHLGKFDAKADDGYFLGYSSISKAFRVYNIRRQQIEKTYPVTFDESTEAIGFTNTSVNEIGIDDSSRYPPDEFQEDDPSR
uniref:Retrovirus-related Pol polyprotein from transposon TNT 1-94 n=1 Tax=Tanacetum cinerariifolium TaxID=118510 RepID=A0A6L2L2B8_TANCI|nr:retrovirus-related Pol polyprotein from transposon TNT 1-94 [Tanacetum cinerariifolium]